MKKDLYELSVEISGVAMIIAGLSNQLDNNNTDTLTAESMQSALYGIRRHLERVAKELEE